MHAATTGGTQLGQYPEKLTLGTNDLFLLLDRDTVPYSTKQVTSTTVRNALGITNTGPVADAQLSTNVPLLNASNRFSNVFTLTNASGGNTIGVSLNPLVSPIGAFYSTASNQSSSPFLFSGMETNTSGTAPAFFSVTPTFNVAPFQSWMGMSVMATEPTPQFGNGYIFAAGYNGVYYFNVQQATAVLGDGNDSQFVTTFRFQNGATSAVTVASIPFTARDSTLSTQSLGSMDGYMSSALHDNVLSGYRWKLMNGIPQPASVMELLGNGQLTLYGSARFTNNLAAATISSSNNVVIAKNGSDTLGSGPFLQLINVTGTTSALLQLSAAGFLDTWMYDGSAWNRSARLDTNSNLTLLGALNTVGLTNTGPFRQTSGATLSLNGSGSSWGWDGASRIALTNATVSLDANSVLGNLGIIVVSNTATLDIKSGGFFIHRTAPSTGALGISDSAGVFSWATTIPGAKIWSGANSFTNLGNVFAGNGAGLTNLAAANITGRLPIDNLGTNGATVGQVVQFSGSAMVFGNAGVGDVVAANNNNLTGSNTLSGATLFNGPFMLMATNLGGGSAVDFLSKPVQIKTLTANTTLTSANERTNAYIQLITREDNTGGWTLTFNFTGVTKFLNATNQSTTPPSMPTNAACVCRWDIYQVEGTNWVYGPSTTDSKLLTDLANNNALTNSLLSGPTFIGLVTNSSVGASKAVVTAADSTETGVSTTGTGNMMRTRSGITRTIYVDAGAMRPAASLPATADTNSPPSGELSDAWDISPTATNRVTFKVPVLLQQTNTTVRLLLYVNTGSQTNTTSGKTNFVWGVEAGIEGQSKSNINLSPYGTAVYSTNDLGTNAWSSSAFYSPAITLGGTFKTNDLVRFRISTYGGNASHTATNTTTMHLGATVFYTEDQTEQAGP